MAVVQNTSQGLTQRISVGDEFISGWLISEDLFSIPEKQSNDV